MTAYRCGQERVKWMSGEVEGWLGGGDGRRRPRQVSVSLDLRTGVNSSTDHLVLELARSEQRDVAWGGHPYSRTPDFTETFARNFYTQCADDLFWIPAECTVPRLPRDQVQVVLAHDLDRVHFDRVIADRVGVGGGLG